MGLITQASSITDTVIQGLSDVYNNQIDVTGSVPPVTFVAVNSTADLAITPNGLVSTTGSLGIGTYTIAGTDSDTHGNVGTWVFTLTVTESISPLVSVVAAQADPPTGIEILVPFQVDSATGGIAVLTNYVEILEQHIATIIMTSVGERVMLPSYGFGLERVVFDPIASFSRTLIASDISKAVQNWEPAVKIIGVNISVSQENPAALVIAVDFSVVPFKDVSTVSITTGGAITQVSTR